MLLISIATIFVIQQKSRTLTKSVHPEKDKRTRTSGFIMERTTKRMKQYFQRLLTEAHTGITVDQWVILQQLDQEDGRSQFDLAQATFKDAPTVTRIIDLLAQKGLVERVPDPQDRRRFRICLTGQGREKIEAVLPLVISFRQSAWAGLTDEQIDQLVHTLNIIFDNLKEE